MIVANISDGLGNQMFQYAFAKHLAIKNKKKLFLYSENPSVNRPFQLDIFKIQYKHYVSKISIRIASNRIAALIFKKIMSSFIEKNSVKIIQQWESFQFKPSLIDTPLTRKNVLLIGYWQSEKYFKSIEQEIRNDFTFNKRMSHKSKEIAALIKKTNSVSIHIRRGDYLLQSTSWAGVCNIKYYREAVSKLLEKQSEMHFFIFSDDIDWCRDNLDFFPSTYIDHNVGKKSYEDMWLMSLCKNNIISNSTFCWWAAWLNKNPDKIVIAPNRWWIEDTVYNVTKDIVPEEWTKLDAFY